MKAYQASLLNAIALVALSLWGYFSSDTPSLTALIPTAIGVILLLLNPGVRRENKVVAHIAVVLTLLILFGLVRPLTGALDRGDTAAVIRVAVMLLTTVLAMIFFVKSFIDARRARKETAQ
ncbi:MAG: hypothetical protein AAF944_24450 [Bacteroidota bacterium]